MNALWLPHSKLARKVLHSQAFSTQNLRLSACCHLVANIV